MQRRRDHLEKRLRAERPRGDLGKARIRTRLTQMRQAQVRQPTRNCRVRTIVNDLAATGYSNSFALPFEPPLWGDLNMPVEKGRRAARQTSRPARSGAAKRRRTPSGCAGSTLDVMQAKLRPPAVRPGVVARPALVNTLRRSGARVDSVDLLHAAEGRRVLLMLVAEAPPGSTIALLARVEPRLAPAVLCRYGEVHEITTAELALNDKDAEVVLRGGQAELPATEVANV